MHDRVKIAQTRNDSGVCCFQMIGFEIVAAIGRVGENYLFFQTAFVSFARIFFIYFFYEFIDGLYVSISIDNLFA